MVEKRELWFFKSTHYRIMKFIFRMKKCLASIFIGFIINTSMAQQWNTNTPDIYFDGGNVGIGTDTPNTTLDVNGILDIRNSGLAMNLGGSAFQDIYFQIRKNSPYGIRFGLKASQFGSTNGIGLIQTGGSRGFGIKVNEQLGFNTVSSLDFFIQHTGNVGIGTISPGEKLEVNGTIRSKEVRVEATGWPDYVFESDYNLRSLEETETYIKENKHLPEIPSAKEMEANGVQLGEMNMLLLKKIEELTLYVIDLKKENEAQQNEIEKLKGK